MSESDPRVVQGKRVLGVVPGQPPIGERKVPDEQDLVMVTPHLLVRHAVVALAVLLLVLIISILFDGPLREVANPFETPNPERGRWFLAALQGWRSHFPPLIAGGF